MGNNRKRVTLRDKQPKGVKPASVHSMVSQTLIDTKMVPIRLHCVTMECHWESREMEFELAKIALIQHLQHVHPVAQQYQPDVQSSLGETHVLPALKSGVDQAEGNYFVKEWEHVQPQAQQPHQPHGVNQSSEGKMDKPVLKSRKKKRKKVKQFETDPSTCNPVMEETLDMVWGRVIREAPMPPTLK